MTKRYPSVVANDGVSLTVAPGEIHAVLGENGAGKSTLMKIIFGAVQPDAGEMQLDGQPVEIANPHQARALGIAMVFQHFSLFDTLTVAENILLGLPIMGTCVTCAMWPNRCAPPATGTACRWSRIAMCIRCPSASASAWRSCARCSRARAC